MAFPSVLGCQVMPVGFGNGNGCAALLHQLAVLYIEVFRLGFLQGVPVLLPIHTVDIPAGPLALGKDGVDFIVVSFIQ